MASIVGIFIDATVGLRDGALVDAEYPIPLPDDDTPIQVCFRVIDDTTLEDPQEDSGSTLSPSVPAGLLACFTVDGMYESAPTTGATAATGGNQAMWLKRDGSPAPDFYDLSVGAETFAAGSRVAAVTDLAATAGYQQEALAWSAVSGADGHEYRYKTTAGSTWSEWAETSSSTAQVVTGLTVGTSYDFEVRGYDERGVGTAGTDTETTLGWADDFADNSLDAALWRTEGSYVAESGGTLNINTLANATYTSLVAGVLPVNTDIDGKVTANVLHGADDNTAARFWLVNKSDIAISEVGAATYAVMYFGSYGTNAASYANTWYLAHWDNTHTRQFWNSAGGGSWSTSIERFAGLSDNDVLTVETHIDHTNELAWWVVKKNGSQIATTAGAKVAFSALESFDAGDDLYVMFADFLTTVKHDLVMTDIIYDALT